MKLYFVTQNSGKVREFVKILGHQFQIIQVSINYPELRSDDVMDIAEIAAKSLAESMKKTVVVEDSGLFIDTLDGFPGTATAYVTKRIGNQGILKLMKGIKNRKAEFESAIGYCEPGQAPKSFFGKVDGTIAKKEKGSKGWGQDPIFIPKGHKKTFAELGQEKNKISHRRKAINKLKEFLTKQKQKSFK